jgi:hypothetical protein
MLRTFVAAGARIHSYLQQPLGARSGRSGPLRAAGPPEMTARGRSGLQRRGHSQVCSSPLGAPMCRSQLEVPGSQRPLKSNHETPSLGSVS